MITDRELNRLPGGGGRLLPPRWAAYSLLAIPVVLILMSFPRWTVDDAFITYRYGQNLADHGSLIWNVGEDPVEGYTGILMPVLLAAGIRLGAQPETVGRIIGISSFLLLIAAFLFFLRRLRLPAPLVMSSAALLVAAPFLYTHAFSGLETIPFAALLLLTFITLHEIVESHAGGTARHGLLAVLILLTALTRPEGAALAMIGMVFVLSARGSRTAARRTAMVYALVLFLPAITYFVWRWRYYGYPLPNTYYAKNASRVSVSTLRSAYHFGRDYLALPVLCAIVVAVLTFREHTAVRLPWRTVAIFLLFSGIVFGQYTVSTLAMNYSYRFFAPYYPVALALLTAIVGDRIARLQGVDGAASRRAKLTLALVVLAWVLQMSFQVRWLVTNESPYARGYARLLAGEHIPAGKYLREAVPEGEWLVVYYDAGAIPYFSGLRTVDFGGLNDEYLAHNSRAGIDARVEYFYSKHPGALVFTSFDRDRPDLGPEPGRAVAARVRVDPRFADYVLTRQFACPDWPDYYLLVYLRKDLPAASATPRLN